MKKIMKIFTSVLILLALLSQFLGVINTYAQDEPEYITYKTVYKDSFNEYRYLMIRELFKIKSKWEVEQVLDLDSVNKLKSVVAKSYNYLPQNNLSNENYFNNLNIAIDKAIKYNDSDAAYVGLVKAIKAYVEDVNIKTIRGKIEATPNEGNAPLNVTLRAEVEDPSGTIIPKYNYVWFINDGGNIKNIGTGKSINYTFKEEGHFKVFVDVKSAHKNSKGYTDVIPYRGTTEVNVKEKIASVVVRVNSTRVGDDNIVKFTPSQAKYGLLFDATSSVPTGGSKFIKTKWDFGNGITKSYNTEPKIERVTYNKEGNYDVKLVLKTNLGKEIEKNFVVAVHDPIATIEVDKTEGYLGDVFHFRAKNAVNDSNLIYSWQIMDIVNDEIILQKQTKAFTYSFPEKGHYNIKLEVSGTSEKKTNVDTKNIYINSRAPVARLILTIPETNKPNRVLLDATESYDPDEIDTGKLKYSWEIDGKRVVLEDANDNGSLGYFTFETIGKHSVVLKVEDLDNIEGKIAKKVEIKSVLSVDFMANPRAIKRGDTITFNVISKNAEFFEWDFGDNTKSAGAKGDNITHTYKKSGIFNVKLTVSNANGHKNSVTKVVYVGPGDKPVAVLDITTDKNSIALEKNACNGKPAYIVSRKDHVIFDAKDSIDIDGNTNNLDYSLKIGNDSYPNKLVNHRFDELGCFPVVLTVTSKTNKATSSVKKWIKVKNLPPTLSSLQVSTKSLETDPVIVEVKAIGATDPEQKIITSYLWYYYTDLDNGEPQDFRSTTTPNTTFVLPKIDGNYYFVVLLTDNDDERISSKELGIKASITMAGDNVNVPILSLKVPDNTVHVGDEVLFNSKVQNILKENLAKTKKVKYFWDFDGDGFYDLETKTGNITHIYDKPGTYYPKLKVKYKGYSNSRNTTINVVNSLIPKLEYVSIGNKFIFFNRTTGSYENIKFDLGDGTTIENKDYFTHKYQDGKSSHIVKIIASDDTTVKQKEIKVVKNIKNLLKVKKEKKGLFLTTEPTTKNSEIIVNDFKEDIIIYYYSKDKIGELIADFNLNKDSDLNGSKDDDSDAKTSKENFVKIKLNNKREQLIRVFVKDKTGEEGIVIDSKDFKIIKKYILQKDIDLNSINFSGVTPEQKEKLDNLKELLSSVSGEEGRTAKLYIAKLKDEWNDENERTKLIYEFDAFLDGSTIQNKDEIRESLEELLLKETDKKDEKVIALRALQGLLPANIQCQYDTTKYKSCNESLKDKLEAIRLNDDVEQNKILAKDILSAVANSEDLTTNQKLDFKATLKVLIYGGVNNIPGEEKKEVIKENEESSSSLTGIFKTIIYVLLGIMGVIGLLFLFWVIYQKFSGDKKDLKEFIKEKTEIKEEEKKGDKNDIFAPEPKKEEKQKEVKKETKNDIFSQNIETKNTETKQEIKLENNIEKTEDIQEKNDLNKQTDNDESDIPDWLKGSLNEVETNSKEETKDEEITEKQEEVKDNTKEDNTEIDSDIPDWLKGSFTENSENKSEDKIETKKAKKEEKKDASKNNEEKIKIKEETNLENFNLEEDTKIDADESNIPDWLKDSFVETEKAEEEIKNIEEEKSEIEENTEKKDISKDKENKEEEKKEEDKEKSSTTKKKTTRRKSTTKTKKTSSKKEESKVEEKTTTKKTSSTPKKTSKKKTTTKTEEKNKDSKEDKTTQEPKSELWDDGMDIPDWLKS